jgi:NitT/TauT family transport system ATP-binding protein
VSVARALVLQPSLLLLDEPFSALDESIRHALQDDLRSLWQSLPMTVVFVTHSIAEAVYLADRAIVFSGAPGTILSDQPIALPHERNAALRLSPQFSAEMKKISELISFRGER